MVTRGLSWRWLICLGLLCPAAGSAHGPHGGHGASSAPIPPNLASGLGASAAFDSRGWLWAVYKEEGYVILRHSENLGGSWSSPRPVNSVPEPIDADGDSRPKIAFGPEDELYVTWTKPLKKLYTGDIRFSRSTDGAKTFSDPVTVNTDRQEITHRFDAVTVNRDGKVFIVWLDKRDQVANAKRNGKASAYRGAAVYFAVSDDQGTSFRGNHKLADHSCECCRIALLPTDNGNVIVMWRHVFAPNIRDHALAEISPDGHAGKLRRATFDDWRVDACPHHGPSLAADTDGSLHAVWFTQAPGKAGVFYGRLHNGGVGAQRRVGGETAAHADLAIIGHRVAVAWKEFDGERSQLRAMLSENGGDSWHEYELATTEGPSDQPRMLVHRKRFYVFWNTRQQPLSVTPLP